ncbi:MAG: peptide deformylase [Clostridiales bacterium]|nr:peptide deformylase [Clostridiales bacterium]
MALRQVRLKDEEVLRKKCKEVKVFDDKLKSLLDDMAETMYHYNGVGIAAPQVGILKRCIVIDIGEGLVELVNPVVVKSRGKVKDNEGCISVPGLAGAVTRPKWVTVEGYTRDGDKIIIEGEDLMARCLCHEVDHLDGILYTDKVEGELFEVEPEEED